MNVQPPNFYIVQPPVYSQQADTTKLPPTPNELIVYLTNKPSQWNSGLCDCCDNMSVCLQGLFCPCHLFGKNVERVENGRYYRSCFCYMLCCGACNHSASRRKLRVKYNLPEEPFNDCCIAWCCGPCSLCQEALEITEQEKPFKQEMK